VSVQGKLNQLLLLLGDAYYDETGIERNKEINKGLRVQSHGSIQDRLNQLSEVDRDLYHLYNNQIDQHSISRGFQSTEFDKCVYKLKELALTRDTYPSPFSLTFDGLLAYEKLKQEAHDSHIAFMAMPFNATKYPLQQTFYTDYLKPKMAELNLPIHRVDSPEKFTHGDINNRMLAQIRQSKCLIADLTGNNLGVLFEAGYAILIFCKSGSLKA
jgi:hypothetical protein